MLNNPLLYHEKFSGAHSSKGKSLSALVPPKGIGQESNTNMFTEPDTLVLQLSKVVNTKMLHRTRNVPTINLLTSDFRDLHTLVI